MIGPKHAHTDRFGVPIGKADQFEAIAIGERPAQLAFVFWASRMERFQAGADQSVAVANLLCARDFAPKKDFIA